MFPSLRTTRQRTAAVVGVAGAAVLVASAGVYALLSASASNPTPQQASSGTLSLVLGDNGAGFTTPISNLAPGDSVRRYVALANNGTLAGQDLALQVTDSVASVLSTDAARGLQIAVDECSVAWTPGTGACAGTTSPVLGSAPLAGFGTRAFPDGGTMAAGQTRHLRLTVQLPDSTEETVNGVLPAGSVQGRSAQLTWKFTESQRTATSSTG
jgi:hypothetical protein